MWDNISAVWYHCRYALRHFVEFWPCVTPSISSNAPRARALGLSFQILDSIEISFELLSAGPHVIHMLWEGSVVMADGLLTIWNCKCKTKSPANQHVWFGYDMSWIVFQMKAIQMPWHPSTRFPSYFPVLSFRIKLLYLKPEVCFDVLYLKRLIWLIIVPNSKILSSLASSHTYHLYNLRA